MLRKRLKKIIKPFEYFSLFSQGSCLRGREKMTQFLKASHPNTAACKLRVENGNVCGDLYCLSKCIYNLFLNAFIHVCVCI